tara:strand:- start:1138 stop:2460 length:1323 start_codon:yes stop_codon:yes gene_type:complete
MKNIYTMKNLFLLVSSSILLLSCSLDADNPNNLLEDQLGVTAFSPMVNGLEASVTRAYGVILAPYAVTTDEVSWIGSRDAWQQLMLGNDVDNINNEYIDAAFFYVAEARYWADDVISRGEEYSGSDAFTSANRSDLVRAYWYGATIYMVIADMFDDFVVTSAKTEAGSPVGPGNMSSLYDTAISYIDKALALNSGLTTELKATKARALFSKGIWAKTNPVNTASPLVTSASAVALALEVLTALGDDFSVNLNTSSSAGDTIGPNGIADQINDRLELRISDEYVISSDNLRPDATTDGNPATTVSLLDPIDNIADPVIFDVVAAFTAALRFPTYPVVTGREMHLIIAEDALASGDEATFTAHINKIRSLDGLSDYSGQIDSTVMLEYARRVNLFMQGRRLADHYRFGSTSEKWIPNSSALTKPGSFFPITISEIQANENVN